MRTAVAAGIQLRLEEDLGPQEALAQHVHRKGAAGAAHALVPPRELGGISGQLVQLLGRVCGARARGGREGREKKGAA